MKVTYTPGKEVKKFTPITLHITVETEEELAELYTRHNIILDEDIIDNNQPGDFDGKIQDDAAPDALLDTIEFLWDSWKND